MNAVDNIIKKNFTKCVFQVSIPSYNLIKFPLSETIFSLTNPTQSPKVFLTQPTSIIRACPRMLTTILTWFQVVPG